MLKRFTATAIAVSLLSTPAYAATWIIGDNDGYGAGVADNGVHPLLGGNIDNRSAAEKTATNGAQFTDTYSTAHPGYGPHGSLTVATFQFTGLGAGWNQGSLLFDMADFEWFYGVPKVTFNGISQNWMFDDGLTKTKVRVFELGEDVLASINALGALTIAIDRNGSTDFYAFDYALLSNGVSAVPEPGTWALMIAGFGVVGLVARRQRRSTLAAA